MVITYNRNARTWQAMSNDGEYEGYGPDALSAVTDLAEQMEVILQTEED